MRIVGGNWGGQVLISPGERVRPTHETVRVRWMDRITEQLAGARIVDLFAGSGALGLEALSRGAAAVDFIENGSSALHALKANVTARKLRPLRRGQQPSSRRRSARIFKRDAIVFSGNLDADAYDIAFADPPYGSRKLDRVLQRWQTVPFAKMLIIEHAVDHAVPQGVWSFTHESSTVTAYISPDGESPRTGR
ncbi:MAG: 16S rRNA (guanine966-N2)-methyltransferase [Bradymonadia bacterium]|jgi:16S rRNA (guanine966-N2)-methyltransferase